jgi:hypothetical protein
MAGSAASVMSAAGPTAAGSGRRSRWFATSSLAARASEPAVRGRWKTAYRYSETGSSRLGPVTKFAGRRLGCRPVSSALARNRNSATHAASGPLRSPHARNRMLTVGVRLRPSSAANRDTGPAHTVMSERTQRTMRPREGRAGRTHVGGVEVGRLVDVPALQLGLVQPVHHVCLAHRDQRPAAAQRVLLGCTAPHVSERSATDGGEHAR